MIKYSKLLSRKERCKLYGYFIKSKMNKRITFEEFINSKGEQYTKAYNVK